MYERYLGAELRDEELSRETYFVKWETLLTENAETVVVLEISRFESCGLR